MMISDMLSTAGDYAITSIIQFLIGILLSIPVYKFLSSHPKVVQTHFIQLGVISTLLGMLLPMGSFGVLPLYIAILCAGGSAIAFIPFLSSNLIFNMLIPYTEISFRWDLSLLRILSAFLIGILSLVVFKVLFKDDQKLIRKNMVDKFKLSYEKSGIFGIFSTVINEVGLFLIVGVLLSAVRAFYISDALGAFLSTEGGGVVRDYLLENNASNNPFFIAAATIFNTIIDLTAPAALFSFLRLRGVLLQYIIIGCFCALLVSTLIF